MNHSDPIEPHTRLTILDPDSERLIDQAAEAGAWVLQHISASDYHALLKNLYHIVVDSVPLMQRAAHVLDRQRPHQRDYLSHYREYLHHHIEEERDHDVWLLEDLAALQAAGVSSDNRPVNAHLARLMAAHWHALHNENPWLLLGHMWTLESRPPSARGMRALRDRLGLTADMTRTYDRHAADDPGHARDLIELIGDPAISAQIRADITLGARVTAAGVTRFWINLSERDLAVDVAGAQPS